MKGHYRYCNFCHNKTFDIEKGLLCKLTSKKPDFKSKCNNFCINQLELEQCQRGVGNYRKRSTAQEIYRFPDISQKDIDSIKSAKEQILTQLPMSNSGFLFFLFVLLCSNCVIIGIYGFVIALISVLLIIDVMLLLFVYKKVSQSVSKKPIIKIDDKGFFILGRYYNWENVIRYYYLSKEGIGANGREYNGYFVVELFDSDEAEMINFKTGIVDVDILDTALAKFKKDFLAKHTN